MTEPNPSRVRTAEASDEEDLVHLCACLHAENGLFPPDFARVRARVRAAIHGPANMRKGVIGVIGGKGDAMQGAAYLCIFQEWYSNSHAMKELFNYVHPDFRSGTRNSHDLIAWSKATADAFELPLFMGIISTTRTEAKERHYRAQLGPAIGHYFSHGLLHNRSA